MKLVSISFTAKGCALQKRLRALLQVSGHTVSGYAPEQFSAGYDLQTADSLDDFAKNAFAQADGIVFIGACGIAVRAIAPHLKSKAVDPAVVVVDELGRYAIPILSGHIGSSNRLAEQIASLLDATPILTTATDINRKFAVDTWASEHNLHIENINCIKKISAAVLNGDEVGFDSDFEVETLLPEHFVTADSGKLGVCVSVFDKAPFTTTLKLIPPVVVLGIGCRRGTSAEKIDRIVRKELENERLSFHAVCKVCSIDLKEKEAGLREFCEGNCLPFACYSAEQLRAAKGDFTMSDFVFDVTGVSNVCERAAVLGSQNGKLIMRKHAKDGVTVAAAVLHYKLEF